MSPRHCLTCHDLIEHGSRCETCQRTVERTNSKARGTRPHYQGEYRKLAPIIRATAETCWYCGRGPLPTDPWQAAHLADGDTDSGLVAAHRSCNIKAFKHPTA
jgi:hypothetical protein